MFISVRFSEVLLSFSIVSTPLITRSEISFGIPMPVPLYKCKQAAARFVPLLASCTKLLKYKIAKNWHFLIDSDNFFMLHLYPSIQWAQLGDSTWFCARDFLRRTSWCERVICSICCRPLRHSSCHVCRDRCRCGNSSSNIGKMSSSSCIVTVRSKRRFSLSPPLTTAFPY